MAAILSLGSQVSAECKNAINILLLSSIFWHPMFVVFRGGMYINFNLHQHKHRSLESD